MSDELRRKGVGAPDVSPTILGLGAAPIGNLHRAMDDATAYDVVATSWECGVRYFDTAPHYGLGLSERRLGSALAGRPRGDAVVSTKVGRLLVPNSAPTGSDLAEGFDVADDLTRVRDYTTDGVRRSLDASLERLGVDYVDIVYIHDPEDHMEVALHEALPALQQLRAEGVVRAVGVGMNLVAPLRAFVAAGGVDVIMVAGRWTLVDRSAQRLLDDCVESKVAVVAAAPFNSGVLAQQHPDANALFDYRPVAQDILTHARRLAQICSNHSVELPHAALRFPLRHPAVVAVVAGLDNPAQVRQASHWARTAINPQTWCALDEDPPEESWDRWTT